MRGLFGDGPAQEAKRFIFQKSTQTSRTPQTKIHANFTPPKSPRKLHAQNPRANPCSNRRANRCTSIGSLESFTHTSPKLHESHSKTSRHWFVGKLHASHSKNYTHIIPKTSHHWKDARSSLGPHRAQWSSLGR